MKSQVLTILLLTIGAHLFQPTHQYRLQKREITEYDLTNFIVTSCSTGKADTFVQNLCDQTLQSALMGHFPFLTYYCQAIGPGNSYCDTLNRYTVVEPNVAAKRFVSRRFVRTVHEDNPSSRKQQLVQILIVQRCVSKASKSQLFCNQTLEAIRQGRFPEMIQLCQSHPESDYCHAVLSLSAFSSSSSSSNAHDSHLTSVAVEPQRMNEKSNQL